LKIEKKDLKANTEKENEEEVSSKMARHKGWRVKEMEDRVQTCETTTRSCRYSKTCTTRCTCPLLINHYVVQLIS
jgi:hypothetical protein